MPHCHTLLKILSQRGYRITPQREMILEVFAHTNDHFTAEEIFDQVQQRTRYINIATVYRTLDMLVDEGLASRADLRDGQVIYTTALHGAHIHLICRQCGQVIKAAHQLIEPVGEALLVHYAFTADLEHTSFTGLCAECQAKTTSQ